MLGILIFCFAYQAYYFYADLLGKNGSRGSGYRKLLGKIQKMFIRLLHRTMLVTVRSYMEKISWWKNHASVAV